MNTLTPEQQALLDEYGRAHKAYIHSSVEDTLVFGAAWVSALAACLDAGFDPFHHPQPQ
jgi:hypothetical protein